MQFLLDVNSSTFWIPCLFEGTSLFALHIHNQLGANNGTSITYQEKGKGT